MNLQQAIASHEDETIELAAIEALRAKLRGQVLAPADGAGYDAARQVWNAMIDRAPALIVRCQGAADVTERRKVERDPAKPQIIEAMRGAGTLFARD